MAHRQTVCAQNPLRLTTHRRQSRKSVGNRQHVSNKQPSALYVQGITQKQLIELGNREHRILLDLYNIGIRKRNESKSLSPRSSQSDKINWGQNQQKLRDYATTTLKRICLSMKNLKARSRSSMQQSSKDTEEAKRKAVGGSHSMQDRESRKQQLKEDHTTQPTRVPDADYPPEFIKSVIRIQKYFRRKQQRKTLLDLLHLRYRPKPKMTSVGINTDPIQLSLPTVVIPRLPQNFAALKNKQAKLLQQKYELLSQTRECEQLQMQYVLQRPSGTATNLHVINQNLVCLIKYLIMYYEQQLTQQIKEPFGNKAVERIRAMSGYSMEQYDVYTISEEIFTEFEQNIIDSLECSNPESKLYEHFHNKALFDAFNEAINRRRAYFKIEGQPFPWSVVVEGIHGPQTKPNLKKVLDKCLEEILNDARTLAGLLIDEDSNIRLSHLDFQTYLEVPLHPVPYVASLRDEKLCRMVTKQLQQEEASWYWFQNQRTQLMFNLSEQIFDILCLELTKVLTVFNFKRI